VRSDVECGHGSTLDLSLTSIIGAGNFFRLAR
jgi:hypothetical protein